MAVANMFMGNVLSQFRSASAKTLPNGKVEIVGIDYTQFKKFLAKEYKTHLFFERFTDPTWSGRMLIDEFFMPEIVYLIDKAASKNYLHRARVDNLIEEIYQNTWYGDSRIDVKSAVDMSVIGKVIVPEYKPLPAQAEFLKEVYWQKKNKYHLNGYLLALPPGGGKSGVSLVLGAALHKKHFIIIAPLSTVHNVWVFEIEKWFMGEQKIWTVKQQPGEIDKTTKFVVLNYESIQKVTAQIAKTFDPNETIIIVDECHNFKDIKALRTKMLYEFKQIFPCPDILLMSGTPVKAFGTEALPIFKMLDPFYTHEVEETIKTLGRFPKVMNELMHNRLGLVMFRKTKEEIIKLPPKHEEDLLIKIPDGKKYTLAEVKKQVLAYSQDRRAYYSQNYHIFFDEYMTALGIFEGTFTSSAQEKEFRQYKTNVYIIQNKMLEGEEMSKLIEAVNQYEKETIEPALPPEWRKKFRNAKTVIKYVELKILGEVLGNLLGKLRTEMTSKIIGKEVIDKIRLAEKKTILFSSYTDSIHIAEEVCKKAGLKPMVITGANSSEAKKIVAEFKTSLTHNPLIASINVMSTGHTINEANTVIFLNVPWREVDYQQSSDRCYRIGQDTDVYVYRLMLDTGTEPNLSTRMRDIVSFSKQQFDQIVDGKFSDDIDPELKGEIKKIFSNLLDPTEIANSISSAINRFTDNITKFFN